jgi:hypothetical protein
VQRSQHVCNPLQYLTTIRNALAQYNTLDAEKHKLGGSAICMKLVAAGATGSEGRFAMTVVDQASTGRQHVNENAW